MMRVRDPADGEPMVAARTPHRRADGRATVAGIWAIAMLGMLGGCADRRRPPTDDERIVGAVLALLARDGRSVCVDDRTQGRALAVFGEMQAAPRPARLDLHWHAPLPLRPDARVTTRALRDAEFGDGRPTIREPDARRDALPGLDQLRLDGAATRLGGQIGRVENGVDIRRSWVPRGVAARWWPLNRIRRDCWPLFEISDPVRDRGMAFVTVRAEHWGTLYALDKTHQYWRIVAEWSRWLY